jgi:ABC-2 type transport system permease protein
MNAMLAVFKREFRAFFATPLAYVFLLIFLSLCGIFTFYLGNFMERGQADLQSFFLYHPWLYLLLVPALSMRLWAEERNTGSIELLLTLPVHHWHAVLAKFVAAWLFCGLCLILSFPMWLTVNYLGDPDNGVIFTAYIGSWMLASGFLAVGCCLSALTNNQVIAFILTAVICFFFILGGSPIFIGAFSDWLPGLLVDAIVSTTFLPHYQSSMRGVIDVGDIVYYLLFVSAWLASTTLAVLLKQAR